MNGIIIINKPKNITSNQTIQKIKTHFKIKKIGHCGTLDPLASGILLVCIGKATKISQELITKNKRYLVEGIIGIKSETDDIDGKIKIIINNLKTKIKNIIKNKLSLIKAEQFQYPSSYSAIKHKGLQLYKYARKGISIIKAKRPANIYNIKLLKLTHTNIILDITCSKGIYIREILNNLSKKTSVPLCVSMIHRLSIDKYKIINSYSLNYILNIKDKNTFLSILIK
ncbi:MAG: tRNA pseudouridine(55) synthase TruB [Enterobacteriaceae bacterium]|nr:tRNA pseudouridine(55) synthase TruB [Enterobacteriaceae bacterium]